jgi:biopolymer transport protein ExbD
MGGASTPGESSGLNIELNLVPFIDLLSSLVLFLLLSAVWVQVAGIETSVGNNKGPTAKKNDTPPKNLGVHLSNRGFTLTWPGGAKGPKTLARKGEQFDLDSLKGLIKGSLKSLESSSVSADDVVPYGNLIQTIDAIKEAGMTSVALSTDN